MRVALIVTGSRGDVQPFIALGRTLIARGHTVTLATHGDFATLVREAGLDFRVLPGSPRDFLAHPALAEALQQGASLFRAARKVPPQTPEHMRALAAAVAATAEDSDLVVNTILSRIPFADDGSRPWASLSWWPLNPTSRWPAMMAPRLRLGPLYNRLTHRAAGLLDSIAARMYRTPAGLPPLPFGRPYAELGRTVPLLCPISRTMFTEPPDWPGLSHITGYWFWDREWEPPTALREFVEAGQPPVTLTLGSIWPVHPPAATLAKVLEVVRSHGRRLIMVGGPPNVPHDVYRLEDAHYPWLFPRSAAVIHHGGCNTTGEALRAGVPQVIVPTFADSPFWAAQAHRMGVAAEPIPYPKFTPERLDASLSTALRDEEVRRRAREVGTAVRAERGTDTAVDLLEGWVKRWRDEHPATVR